MSKSELIKRYTEEICPKCNNKKSKLCNIKTYRDYSDKNVLCCKCVYFGSDKNIDNEIKSH